MTSAIPRQRIVSGFLETIYCCCLHIFGEALYNLEIGTPIEPVSEAIGSKGDQAVVQSWIRNILSFYIEVGNSNSIHARELREILGRKEDVDNDEFPESIPSLIIIRSDACPDTSDNSKQRTS